MIGGTVIDTKENKLTVEIIIISDRSKENHSVFVPLTAPAKCIQPDDSVFWNDDKVFWSPKERYFRDFDLGKPIKSFCHSGLKELAGATK